MPPYDWANSGSADVFLGVVSMVLVLEYGSGGVGGVDGSGGSSGVGDSGETIERSV